MNEIEIAEYVELIDELQQKGIGNPNNLIEIKQILVKDRELDENNLQYLTELDVQLDGKINRSTIRSVEQSEIGREKRQRELDEKKSKESILLKNRFSCDICGTIVSGNVCSNCHKDYDMKKNVTKKSYSAWYVVSILFGFSGALIAWAFLRNENNAVATNCLVLGIIVSVISLFVLLLVYM